jgi:hypothetical protein
MAKMTATVRRRVRIAPTLVVLALGALPAAADIANLPAARDSTLCDGTIPGSNGAGEHMFVGKTGRGQARRAVIAFDVAAAVPAGSTIVGVTLDLTMSRTQPGLQTIALHRLTTAWGEGTSDALNNEGQCAAPTTGDATWVDRLFPGTPWTMPGGDFVMLASASMSVGPIGIYTFGSTAAMVADVQAWLDTPASDFGWILIGNEAVDRTAKRFDTRENAIAGARPVLTVDYQPPAGAPTVYESAADPPDRCAIVQAANAIGSDPATITFTPAAGSALYYQVDADTDCLTEAPGNTLRMVKDPADRSRIIASY